MRPNAMSVGCSQYQTTASRMAPTTARGIAHRGSRVLSSSAMKPSCTRCPINIVCGEEWVARAATAYAAPSDPAGGAFRSVTFSPACLEAWAT